MKTVLFPCTQNACRMVWPLTWVVIVETLPGVLIGVIMGAIRHELPEPILLYEVLGVFTLLIAILPVIRQKKKN